MAATINANIREFLRNRIAMEVALERAKCDFRTFWAWIGAEGDLDAALAQWDVYYHK
jgi:hypothetical protein